MVCEQKLMIREYYRAKLLCVAAVMTLRHPLLLVLSFWAAFRVSPVLALNVPGHIDSKAAAKGQQLAQVNLPSSIPAERLPVETLPPADINPDLRPEPPASEVPLPQLPPVEELLGNPDSPNTPPGVTSGSDETFVVNGIQLAGSTVFTDADFADIFASYVGRPISFSELLELRSAVTERYVEKGFLT